MSEKAMRIKKYIYKKYFGLTLITGGALGLFAAYKLTIDKITILEDPSFIPSCNINPILSCGSVMTSDQAEALGFPNPILGLIGFSAVIVVGVALLDGAKFSKWFWRLFNLGTLAGFLFNHYLIYQSLYNIGSLCLWCMLVWTVTWPIFLFTTIYAVENKHWRPKGVLKTLLDFVRENSIGILFAWYVIIIGLILNNFWYYWETIIPLI